MKPGLFTSIVLGMVLSACSLFKPAEQDERVARVQDVFLLASELDGAIPDHVSAEDSAVLAERYIDKWVKEQLMCLHARHALSEEQQDFERQLAAYHRSLLIYNYRKELLRQKLDTLVPESEIKSYYQKNLNNYLLEHDIIKGSYIKLPRSAPRINEVRQWSRSNGEDDLAELRDYCSDQAEKFSDFNDEWIDFPAISQEFPMQIYQPSRYLRYNKNLETKDSLYRYFLHISDHIPKGETAPLELVKEDIINIILNKRKLDFIRQLEQQVYREGISRNQFEIYK